MEQRSTELSSITDNYNNRDVTWLATGDVNKLQIGDNKKIKLEVEELNSNTKTNKKSRENNKSKREKRVKFESNIIESVKNYEVGKAMAHIALDKDRVVQNSLENNMVIKDRSYKEPSEIMKQEFNNLNNKINGKISEEKEKFVDKLKIIKEIEERDNIKKTDSDENSIELKNIFKNMKLKTQDSDIISAKKNTNTKNIENRIDNLEQYMIDIIRNQQIILQKMNKSEKERKEREKKEREKKEQERKEREKKEQERKEQERKEQVERENQETTE